MSVTFNKDQLFGLAGSLLLLVGAFLPIISMPFVGNLALYSGLDSAGALVFITAIAALILVFCNQVKLLIIPGLLSLSVILYKFYEIYDFISSIQADKHEGAHNTLFGGLANAMAESVKLEFGWIFLIAGSVLLLLAPFFQKQVVQYKSTRAETIQEGSPVLKGILFFLAIMTIVIAVIIHFALRQ